MLKVTFNMLVGGQTWPFWSGLVNLVILVRSGQDRSNLTLYVKFLAGFGQN